MKNRLAIILLVLASLLLPACTVWREHPSSTNWKDATGGEGLVRSLWQEVKDKKWNELEQHISSNYIGVSREGSRLDKEATMAYLRQVQLDDYTLGDFQSEMNSETFVVTYTVAMRGTSGGQPIPPEPVRMITVWQKQKAGWLAIAHSAQEVGKK